MVTLEFLIKNEIEKQKIVDIQSIEAVYKKGIVEVKIMHCVPFNDL